MSGVDRGCGRRHESVYVPEDIGALTDRQGRAGQGREDNRD